MSEVDYDLLGQLVESGLIDEAVKIVNNISDPGRRYLAMHFLVVKLSQFAKFREALKLARMIEDKFMYTRSLSEIIHSLLLYGRLSEALGIAFLMPEEYSSLRLKEFTTLASELARKGRTDEAVLALNEAMKALRKLPKNKLEDLEKASSLGGKSSLEALIRLINEFLKINIELPRKIIQEGEDLEVVISSNIEVENVLVEFEGLDLSPVKLERLKDEVLKLNPSFVPGERKLLIIISFEILGRGYVFTKEFVVMFKKR